MRAIRRKQKKVEIKFVIKGSKFYCHPPLSRCFLMMIKEVKGGEGRCKTNNAFQYVPTEFYAISKGLFICIINCWWVICRVLICSLLLSPKNLHRCVILCRLNKTSKWFFINIPVACFLFSAAFLNEMLIKMREEFLAVFDVLSIFKLNCFMQKP